MIDAIPHGAIAFDGVDVTFDLESGDKLVVVRECSIAAESGQIVCITGRSGSGKTSLLRAGAAIRRPERGEILWNGQSAFQMSDPMREKRRGSLVGYVDQSASLIDHLTALENVLVPAGRLSRSARSDLIERARSLMDMLAIGNRLTHRPAAMSGGERQRVAMARALLLQPAILILDEPTSSLDRTTADRVISLLRDHAENGGAILLASHDPSVIEAADLRLGVEAHIERVG